MEANKQLTPEQKRELWEKCGLFEEKRLRGESTYSIWWYDGKFVGDYPPPTDLNNLEKYAWPVAVKILGTKIDSREVDYYGTKAMFYRWTDKVLEGYSLTDALALVCYKVICENSKTFKMYRTLDISATHDSNQANPPDEVQFEGVVFSDGKVAIRWLTAKRSVAVWDSMEDMLAIHGHPEYGSKLVWDSDRTEGDNYQEQYCGKCIHGETSCAILGTHFRNNYNEANKKDSILHDLIPYQNGRNGQCRMFIEQAGYRKLPAGDPNLLSDEEIQNAADIYTIPTQAEWAIKSDHRYWQDKRIAQAQLDSDKLCK